MLRRFFLVTLLLVQLFLVGGDFGTKTVLANGAPDPPCGPCPTGP